MSTCQMALFNVGSHELLIVLAVALLLFGGKRLPELARGMARGMRVFREELRQSRHAVEELGDLSTGRGDAGRSAVVLEGSRRGRDRSVADA